MGIFFAKIYSQTSIELHLQIRRNKMHKVYIPFIVISYLFISTATYAQRNINDVIDSTTVNNLLVISKKFGSVSLSGYLQPQFQYAQANGAASDYQGGAFGENANNRFRLRRGRLRADYSLLNEDGTPSTYFVFQFDGTEQGVNVRDFWGRYYEHHFQLFYFTAGLAGRPLVMSFNFHHQLERLQNVAECRRY